MAWDKNFFVPVSENADITELLNPEAPVVFDETLDRPLIDYPLSVRTLNCLKAASINTLRELVRLTEKDMLKYHGFGKRSITELSDFLKDHDLTWGMSV
jgi:DNA-directed RNA polymerase subunit alpha